MTNVEFSELRKKFHRSLITNEIISFHPFAKFGVDKICSNADKGQKHSVIVSNLVAEKISSNTGEDIPITETKLKGQTLGNIFENECAVFLENTFSKLSHLRPGTWTISHFKSRGSLGIGAFEQYEHLAHLNQLAAKYSELKNFLGDGYTVSPDVVVARIPEPDDKINTNAKLVDDYIGTYSPIRSQNHESPTSPAPILHASISCKFTMRSDRAQNTRTEALNLIRARKGQTPHIVSVTAEPTITRIASLALGTGDVDCVYHFALYELQEVLSSSVEFSEAHEFLVSMVEGKRLKDISDLPLDLAI